MTQSPHDRGRAAATRPLGNASSVYYDATYASYRFGWSSEHLHCGMWDTGVSSHAESLVRTVDRIRDALDIGPTDRVLDAGCGVGGASRYLAEQCGCKVVGIMNSEVLFDAAYAALEDSSACRSVCFRLLDFEKTDFRDESFTKVFALESASHALSKRAFATEAFRLLQPGGKLLVSDGYQAQKPIDDGSDAAVYQQFLEGWALPHLETPERFQQMLTEIGFVNVRYTDMTAEVMKSVEHMHRNARFSRTVHWLLHSVGLISEIKYRSAVSAYLLKVCIDRGIMVYGFLYAEKPLGSPASAEKHPISALRFGFDLSDRCQERIARTTME